jgi:hypothetical protein
VTAPAARGTNHWVTCFTCGQKGHRSTECNGTPPSWEDQVKVREKVARRAAASGSSFAAPLSGSNSVSLVKTHPLIERRMSGGADNVSQEQPRILPINNIQLVRMGNSQSTTAAFAMLHRIPGVPQAIKNSAMGVKRGRYDGSGGEWVESPGGGRYDGSGGGRSESPGGGPVHDVFSVSVLNVVVPPKKVVAVDAVSYAVMFAGGEKFIVFIGEKVHVVSFPVQGIGDDEFVVIAGRRSMVGDGGLRGRRRHRRPGRMVATLSARLALDCNWRWRHSRRHGRTVEGRREMASTGPLAGLDLFSLLPKIGALQAAGRIFFPGPFGGYWSERGKVDTAEISALRDGGGLAGPLKRPERIGGLRETQSG